MEFKSVVKSRRSVRKFSNQEVEESVLREIIDVAMDAPSSRNSRSTSFMVVRRREHLERIAQMRDYGSAFVSGAAAAIVVVCDCSATDLWEVNGAISATVLQLAITDAALSSCWVHVAGRPQLKADPEGAQAEEVLREFLPIPEGSVVLCCVALGYSDFAPASLPEFDRESKIQFID